MAWFSATVTASRAAVILAIVMTIAATNPSYAQSSGTLKDDGGWSINKTNAQASIETQQTAAAIDTVEETPAIAENDVVEQASLDVAAAADASESISVTQEAQAPEQGEIVQGSDSQASNSTAAEIQAEPQAAVQDQQNNEPSSEDQIAASEPDVGVIDEVDVNQLTAEEQAQADAIAAQQLAQALEQQFAQLQQTLETEDAFSGKLGEDYLGYGKLLRQAGQVDESIKALTTALHIAKVNNGIYSIEQRPALRELFDIHYELANTEDFEDYLERILWIENKNPQFSDSFSYEILLKVGNRYIDQFLQKPLAGQASVEMLLRAKRHLITAVRAFGKRPVSEILMPYGELALISFLESKILPNIDRTASLEDSRLRSNKTLGSRELTIASYIDDPFPKGESYLQIYLRKAQREGNTEHVVRALTGLGDLNQLFGRYANAGRYYELAWLATQDQDPNQQPVVSFDQPTLLPDFNYAYQRQNISEDRETVSVTLKLSIGSDGRVKDIQRANPDDGLEKYFPKARRAVKRLVFRPQLVDAKAVVTDDVEHITKVRLRR